MVAVRLLYSDCAGVRRCRVVPLPAALGEEDGPDSSEVPSVGLTSACMSHPHYGDICSPGSGLSPTGEWRLTAASRPLRCSWYPAHYMAPADMLHKDGTPWSCCPRSTLKRALQQLQDKHQLRLMVGFELEFILLCRTQEATSSSSSSSSSDSWREVDQSQYCHSGALDSSAAVLDVMVAAIQALGVTVLQYHAESAPGQFEIATGPAEALQAADQLQMCREAIRGVAHQAGMEVSFAPKPFPDQAGNGCHCHWSLWHDSEPSSSAMTEEGDDLTPTAAAFCAGLLEHLPGLLCWTAPSVHSYARLAPNCWSGAYAIWGWDNREAPLRVTCPGDASSLNVEYKAFDGSTNPHLALAAMVATGMLGLKQGLQLPPPVDGNQDDPSVTGRHPRLPASLPDSLAEYQKDTELQAAVTAVMGDKLHTAFLAVRAAEVAHEQVVVPHTPGGRQWMLCW